MRPSSLLPRDQGAQLESRHRKRDTSQQRSRKLCERRRDRGRTERTMLESARPVRGRASVQSVVVMEASVLLHSFMVMVARCQERCGQSLTAQLQGERMLARRHVTGGHQRTHCKGQQRNDCDAMARASAQSSGFHDGSIHGGAMNCLP